MNSKSDSRYWVTQSQRRYLPSRDSRNELILCWRRICLTTSGTVMF